MPRHFGECVTQFWVVDLHAVVEVDFEALLSQWEEDGVTGTRLRSPDAADEAVGGPRTWVT